MVPVYEYRYNSISAGIVQLNTNQLHVHKADHP